MANFLSSCSLLVVLLHLPFLLTNGAPLDDVCRQTRQPRLCLTILGSDPGSRSATLTRLAEIAIFAAQDKGLNTKFKIHTLLLSENNPRLKNLYGQCEGHYFDALTDLAAAFNSLVGGRYADLRAEAARVVGYISSCERVFPRSQFAEDNRYVLVLGNALVVIANLL